VFCHVKMPLRALLWAVQPSNSHTPSDPSGHWNPHESLLPWTPTATQSRATLPLPRPCTKPARRKPRVGGSHLTREATHRSHRRPWLGMAGVRVSGAPSHQ
jgi:hypothetical protein